MEHVVLKLITSEMVIGRVESNDDDGYTLEYPMLLNFTNDVFSTKSHIYLTSLNPFYVEQIIYTIKKSHIMFATPADEEFINFYEKYLKKKIERQLKEELYDDEMTDLEFLKSLEFTANTNMH